jgi:hypothetical protein
MLLHDCASIVYEIILVLVENGGRRNEEAACRAFSREYVG